MKLTQQKRLTELLKVCWLSSFQMQQMLQSSSADRVMRRIRSNPPSGYIIKQRNKVVPAGYSKCLEYRLVKEDNYV